MAHHGVEEAIDPVAGVVMGSAPREPRFFQTARGLRAVAGAAEENELVDQTVIFGLALGGVEGYAVI